MTKSSDQPDAASEGLSIGGVAAATGLSTETLRIWERRYGKPVPVRLPSGHRRYTAEQVRWLRRVASALAMGNRPLQIMKLDDAQLDALLGKRTASKPRSATTAWVKMIASFKGEALVEALRDVWANNDPLTFLEDHVAPFIDSIGRAWADGDIEVRHEHFAAELVEHVIRRFRNEIGTPARRPAVVLTTLPGERHGLGIQMAALLCAANRVPVSVLGVDTPLDDTARAAGELAPKILGISVSLATGGVETDRTLAALRGTMPSDVRLVVGGEGARGVRRGPRGVEYMTQLAVWDEAMRDLKTRRRSA